MGKKDISKVIDEATLHGRTLRLQNGELTSLPPKKGGGESAPAVDFPEKGFFAQRPEKGEEAFAAFARRWDNRLHGLSD